MVGERRRRSRHLSRFIDPEGTKGGTTTNGWGGPGVGNGVPVDLDEWTEGKRRKIWPPAMIFKPHPPASPKL